MDIRASEKKRQPAETPLMDHYQEACSEAGIYWDSEQAQIVEILGSLASSLAEYLSSKTSLLSVFNKSSPPKGVYIWGDVGRGKSFLMDLFFHSVDSPSKRRVHFHAFMQEVHYTLHSMDQEEKGLESLAKQIAEESRLLCFDEFQVTNIADAMIMKRLFEVLFNEGVVIVATSNTAPQSLYEKGLHRDRFLPFVEVLEQHVFVTHLDGRVDYRRSQVEGQKRYFTPLDTTAHEQVDFMWEQLTGGDQPQSYEITSHGRTLEIPLYAHKVGRFHFRELCGLTLGPTDYLALAENLKAMILEGIPILSSEDYDEALRFQTLVDILYDQGVLLVASGEGPIDQIYQEGKGIEAFKRTVSRLYEMCHV